MVFVEDKNKLLVQHVLSTSLLMLLIAGFSFQRVPTIIFILVLLMNICVNLFLYLRNLKREYFVKVSESFLEYCDTCQSKVAQKYEYSEIRKIEPYWGGVTLYFVNGPARRKNIETFTIKNGSELKKLLIKRWRDFKKSHPVNPSHWDKDGSVGYKSLGTGS